MSSPPMDALAGTAASSLPRAPWLARVPAALFAMPFGLFGLAGAFRRAGGAFGWSLAADTGAVVAALASAILGLLLALYLAKCLRHPGTVRAEYAAPVPNMLMALIPLSLLVAAIWYGGPGRTGWMSVVLLALVLQAAIALRVVARLTTGAMPPGAVTPALYLPPVGGGLVGGMALAVNGQPGWAALLFGMGLAGWALLEVRVLNRLFEGPMPEPLRPTIGVELAPPAVTTLSAAVIWPALPAEVLVVGLGVFCGPLVAVGARWRWWARIPFSAGFWSFSFPLAALAASVVEAVHRGGWPPEVSAIALSIVSAVFVLLAARTVGLLLRGRLIPPPAVPGAA